MTRFKSSVEDWRSLVEQLANGKPADFALGWINIESGGNPCDYTYLRESGIGQLMYPDNLVTAGTTEAQQHPSPPCVAWTGPSSCIYRGACPARTITYFGSLTPDQQYEQVRALWQYIDACIATTNDQMATYSYNWDPTSSDYWSMVKFQHVVPAYIPHLMQLATDRLGGPPSSWYMWRTAIADQLASHPDWLDNAEKTGNYVSSSIFNDVLITIGGGPNADGTTSAGFQVPTWLALGLGVGAAVASVFAYRRYKGRLGFLRKLPWN